MEEIFARLYDMTAFSNIIADPSFLVMYAIAFILLYLGIKKHYEPLLLVPIAFGVLIANFPGGEMGVIQADQNGMVLVNGVMKNIWEMPLHEIAHDLGLMNFIYYMLIIKNWLTPVISRYPPVQELGKRISLGRPHLYQYSVRRSKFF